MRIITLLITLCLFVCIPFGCASMAEATEGEIGMSSVMKTDLVDIDLHGNTVYRHNKMVILGEGDNNANRFGVRILRDNEHVNIDNCTVVGYFIRHTSNETLVFDGSIQNNEDGFNIAYVTLPQECYEQEGSFSLAIKLVGHDTFEETVTMRIVDGVVVNTSTNTIVKTQNVISNTPVIVRDMEKALRQVQYLNDLKIIENDTDNTSAEGVPAHSVWVIVRGGSSANVARAIYENKPAWVGTYGSTSSTVTDESGTTHTVNFSRAKVVAAQVSVVIQELSGYDSETTPALIKQAVVEYFNSMKIGQSLIVPQIATKLTNIAGTENPPFAVVGVAVATSRGSSSGMITPNADEYFWTDANSIFINP